VQPDTTRRLEQDTATEGYWSDAGRTAISNRFTASSGFSLIELLVVMAVMLVVAAFAVPSLTNTMDAYRVRSAMNDISGLTQRCRVQSLRKNTSERMYVKTTGGMVQLFCQDIATGTGVVQSTDPQISLLKQFSIPGTPTGGPTQLTGTTMWGSANAAFAVDSDPYFSSRGLPCAAVGVGTACSTITGYVYYVKYTTRNSARWAALSISPAGRVQNWFWNGTGWGN
jgi:prepilin-type N-terminal cleavage/methylation domain-containing protein